MKLVAPPAQPTIMIKPSPFGEDFSNLVLPGFLWDRNTHLISAPQVAYLICHNETVSPSDSSENFDTLGRPI
jgi:hypothetical protein